MKGGVYRMLTLQQHCNSFAVALQFVCSDAAANVQQLQAI